HAAAPESPPPPAPPQGAAMSTAAPPASATPAHAATPEPYAASAGGLLHTDRTLEAASVAPAEEPEIEDEAGEVGLGYYGAVRGIVTESAGGPLHPAGVRMGDALQEGGDSLDRDLEAEKRGRARREGALRP